MKKNNILFINPYSLLYGAEKCLLDIIRCIDNTKYKAIVLLPEEGPLSKEIEALGVELHYFKSFERAGTPFPLNKLIFSVRFYNFIKKKNIKLVHFNMYRYIEKFFVALKLAKIPIIVHVTIFNWLNFKYKFLLSKSDRIICVSRAIKDVILQKRRSDFFIKIKEEKVSVIYDGREMEGFLKPKVNNNFRREFHIKEEEYLVGLVGAIDKRKGQDIFIQAASEVVKGANNIKFVIIGDTYFGKEKELAFKSQIINLCKELNLQDKIIFTGARNDVKAVLKELDLLVTPSLRDPLPGSIIEGMASGLPVIGTKVDGIPEIIGDDGAGILINPENSEELKEGILRIMNDEKLSLRMGKIGRKRAIELFSLTKCIREIEKLYGTFLERQKI